MGSGPRKKNTKYLPPDLADGIGFTCPETFSAVRVAATVSVLDGAEYPMELGANGMIVVGVPDVVATATDPPESLKLALLAGCDYIARFPQPTDGGQPATVEVFLE